MIILRNALLCKQHLACTTYLGYTTSRVTTTLDLQASCTVFLYCKNFDVFFDVFDQYVLIILSSHLISLTFSYLCRSTHVRSYYTRRITHEGYVHFRGHDQGHDLFKVSRYTCVILHNSFVPKITISKAFSLHVSITKLPSASTFQKCI